MLEATAFMLVPHFEREQTSFSFPFISSCEFLFYLRKAKEMRVIELLWLSF